MSTSIIRGMEWNEGSNTAIWYKSIIKEIMRYLEKDYVEYNIMGIYIWINSMVKIIGRLHLRRQFIGILIPMEI